MPKGYVINLHLCENCNFHCKPCFAKFGSHCVLTADNWKYAIDNILTAKPVSRFNLAGGEPLLYSELETIIDHIRSHGVEVSVITNGFLLTEKRLDSWAGKVSTIGISIDGLTQDTIFNVGRCTAQGEYLNKAAYLKLCAAIRERGFLLKTNTVVSSLNRNETFIDFFREAQPNRCKLLKMQLFQQDGFSNTAYDISETDFDTFTKPYLSAGLSNLVIEKNMTNSYIFVDSSGWLLDNSNNSYRKIGNFLYEKADTVFEKMVFNEPLYQERY